MASSFTMNNILRFEGKASLAMIGLTTGGILNMVLDPLLIFGLHLGIAGAAIATGLSQLISWSILLSIFFCAKPSAAFRCVITPGMGGGGGRFTQAAPPGPAGGGGAGRVGC